MPDFAIARVLFIGTLLALSPAALATEAAVAPGAGGGPSAPAAPGANTAVFCEQHPERCSGSAEQRPAANDPAAPDPLTRQRREFCQQNPERCAAEKEEIREMREGRRQNHCAEHPEQCIQLEPGAAEPGNSCKENPNQCTKGQKPGYKSGAKGPQRKAFCDQQPEVCRQQRDELKEVRD